MTTSLETLERKTREQVDSNQQSNPAPSFESLGVPAKLAKVLAREGKNSAFPIQQDTLPDTLSGRDVLGRGRTGSGKTLAFSLPIVARLGGELAGGKRRPGRPLALVLAPTRELATQITAVIEPLANEYHLKTTTIFGGVSQKSQVAALKAGVDIVVACPGRLEDLLSQKMLTLDAVEITVLDEADHMADLGFLPGVTRIMKQTPSQGQRLLFSATLDNGVDKLVKQFLHNEVLHSVEAMTHHVFEVADVESKNELIRALASGQGRRILFMRTKHHARKLARKLTEQGIPAVDLHGNLSQNARDRNLAEFASGGVRVLVATDVAARGVHVDDIELVIHVDPPAEHKAYLHRSGRTARAGSSGTVVTISLPAQKKDLATILRRADISVTPVQVNANSHIVQELVGEKAAYVKPAPRHTNPPARRSKPTSSSSEQGRSGGLSGRPRQRKQSTSRSTQGQTNSRQGQSSSRQGQVGSRRQQSSTRGQR